MSLKTFESGELISASDFNNNFTELNTRITNTNTAMSAMNTSFLSTVQNMLSVYQDIETPTNTSGTVTLEDNKIYRFAPAGNITFSLPLSSGLDNTKFHQILVQVNMTSTLYSVNFGTSWGFNSTIPQITQTGKYNVIYEHDGTNWICGVMSRNEVI